MWPVQWEGTVVGGGWPRGAAPVSVKITQAVCEVRIGLLHNRSLLCVGFDLMLQLTVSCFTDQSLNIITSSIRPLILIRLAEGGACPCG